jgi:N-acetylmuramoyl-L-alanine amidase
MAVLHKVSQGEHASGISHQYGLTDYRKIWNHPSNSSLKQKRQNPHVLFPGDLVSIPDPEPRVESCCTDKRHSFRMRGPVLRLRLVLEDLFEKPIANARCVLVLENEFCDVTTDGDGRIDQTIPPDVCTASLVIQDAQTPFDFVQIPMKIGYLDPANEISGQQARLNNLGYFPGDSGDKEDSAFRSAVEEFQCDHGLGVDGVCGPKTQARLKEVHGC